MSKLYRLFYHFLQSLLSQGNQGILKYGKAGILVPETSFLQNTIKEVKDHTSLDFYSRLLPCYPLKLSEKQKSVINICKRVFYKFIPSFTPPSLKMSFTGVVHIVFLPRSKVQVSVSKTLIFLPSQTKVYKNISGLHRRKFAYQTSIAVQGPSTWIC